MFKTIKQLGKKAKALGVIATGAVLTTASQAAVTYDEVSNALVGSIDMGPFYSGVGIAFAVIGAVLAVGLAIRIVKRGN